VESLALRTIASSDDPPDGSRLFGDASIAPIASARRLLRHDLGRQRHPSRAIAFAAIRAPHWSGVSPQTRRPA
jgi:hypothetical protein